MVRPGGLEVDRSRRELDPFERGACRRTAPNRSRRSGASRQRTAVFMLGCNLPACSVPTITVKPGCMLKGCRTSVTPAVEPRRCRANPSFSRASSERREPAVDRHLGGRRVSHVGSPAGPGSPVTREPAPISCRRGRTIQSSASACTASLCRQRGPTGSISRTIAACTVQTTAARAGRA